MNTPADLTHLPAVALVTAYNEAETIGAVIDALKACDAIDRVHVVDDGSTDDTRAVALSRDVDVTTISHRVPVGEAIMRHLDVVDEECILVWCDADLLGLKPAHIDTLVARYRAGGVSQSLSSRAVPPNWPSLLQASPVRWIWKSMFGPISGERVILRSDFVTAIDTARQLGWCEMMSGYGIVLFLNWYLNRHSARYSITYFEGLRQRQKYQKWGGAAGLEMVKQWLQFAKVWLKIRLNARRINTIAARTS